MQWRSLHSSGNLAIHMPRPRRRTRRNPVRRRVGRSGRRPAQSGLARRAPPIRTPLDLGYTVLNRWYADIVGAGGFSVTGRYRGARWGPLVEIVGRMPGGIGARFAVATQHGFPVVRSEFAVHHAGGDDVTVAEPRKVEKVGGPRLCTAGDRRWSIMEGGRPIPVQRKPVALEDIVVGAVPESRDEAPAPPTGAVMTDCNTGRFWRVGADGELIAYGRIGEHGPPSRNR